MDAWKSSSDDAALTKAHSFIDRVASEHPARPAIMSTSEPTLTYGQLCAQADNLAELLRSYLINLPVGSERLVGIHLRKSNCLYVVVLAVLKAGAAYVPLDPELPALRLRQIVEDCKMCVAVSDEGLDQTALHGLAVLDVGGAPLRSPSYPERSTEVTGRQESDLAYVYFTSGSTGKPKGVMIEHSNVIAYAAWAQSVLKTGPGRRILQFTTISFDLSVSDIFATLMFGGTLVIPSADERRSFDRLANLIDTMSVNTWMVAPAYLERMPLFPLVSLDTIVVVGEVCSPTVIERWSEGRTFFNGYGPTECTVIATIKQISSGDECRNIGSAIAGTQLHILDEGMNPVAPGEKGELYISGPGVGRGYLYQPNLTDERFTEDPFAPGNRMYKTGDVVWQNRKDYIFVGRADRQIKIQGHRVELSEIEAGFIAHGFKQAVVIVRRNEADAHLVAHICNPDRIDVADALERLRASFPDYMIPAFFVEHEEIPLNSVGKTDLKRLADIDPIYASVSPVVPPVGLIETQLVDAWSQILGLPPRHICVEREMRALGAKSLHGIRVLAFIKNQFGLGLRFADLTAHSTVRTLATKVTIELERHDSKG